jgi:predicted nucleic acid-binding protein
VRLSTKLGLFRSPLSAAQAIDRVETWLGADPTVVVEPTTDHRGTVRPVLAAAGTGGNLVNDAHVAALAIEHRGGIDSFDSDFSRFDGVVWNRPGA